MLTLYIFYYEYSYRRYRRRKASYIGRVTYKVESESVEIKQYRVQFQASTVYPDVFEMQSFPEVDDHGDQDDVDDGGDQDVDDGGDQDVDEKEIVSELKDHDIYIYIY